MNRIKKTTKLKSIQYLQFEGLEYPYRDIWFDNRWNIVATNDLNDKVYGNGNYPSKEAQRIDEQILFYVNPDEINLPSSQIQRILKLNIV